MPPSRRCSPKMPLDLLNSPPPERPFAMRLKPPLALTAPLSAALLMGCAGPVQTVLAPPPPIPDALLTCRDQPEPPAIVTDADLADFILDLAGAGDECRSRLAAVRKTVNP